MKNELGQLKAGRCELVWFSHYPGATSIQGDNAAVRHLFMPVHYYNHPAAELL